MKKVWSILLVGLFIVGLSSCNSRKDRCPSVGKVEQVSQEIIG